MARILIVDDEPLIAMMTAEWVEDLGHTPVGPARTLAEALELLGAGDIDNAILDVSLGKEKSYPLADALVASRIPFAFATGALFDIEPGDAVAVLAKPFALKQFEEAIEAIVSNRVIADMPALATATASCP